MSRFVAFDIEMPGQRDMRISAIGITVVDDGKITDKRFYLVNPECKFDPYVIKLIGITPDMVKDKPIFPEVWEEIKDIMSSGILVAHGAAGDLKTLCECLLHYGIEWKSTAEFLCTCDMGLACYPCLEGHGLDALCEHIGFELDHHNAQSDSEGCARILLDFINQGADINEFKNTFDCIACRKIRPGKVKKKNVIAKIHKELFSLQSLTDKNRFMKKHPDFNFERVIGIKPDKLYSYSRRLIKTGRSNEFLRSLPHFYFEENILHAILISGNRKFNKVIYLINRFLPFIDRFEICDYIRPKIFKQAKRDTADYVISWLTSSKEIENFLGICIAEKYLFTEAYAEKWLSLASQLTPSAPELKKRRAAFISALHNNFEYLNTSSDH